MVLKRGLSNKQGISLITSAIEKGNTPVVKELYKQGFRADRIVFTQRNHLFFKKIPESKQQFLNHWQTMQHLDTRGRNGMHLAAMYGSATLLRALSHDFPQLTNAREWLYGATPLHLAMITGNKDNVSVLRSFHADESVETFFEMDAKTLEQAISDLSSAALFNEPKAHLEIISRIADGEQQLFQLEKDWNKAVEWEALETPVDAYGSVRNKAKKLHEALYSICPKKTQ